MENSIKIPKSKTITELRNTIFETFDELIAGESQVITHKNGSMVAMISVDKIEGLYEEINLQKNLAIGYAQAMRGEGVTSPKFKKRLSPNVERRMVKWIPKSEQDLEEILDYISTKFTIDLAITIVHERAGLKGFRLRCNCYGDCAWI